MQCPPKALAAMKEMRVTRANYKGICSNIRMRMSSKKGYLQWELWAHETWRNWPDFSGCDEYPVKPALPGTHPLLAFGDAYRNYSLWLGEYGAARLRLLNYLIEQAEKEQNDQAD